MFDAPFGKRLLQWLAVLGIHHAQAAIQYLPRFGPIPAERAIKLLIQVCHSLGEAHEQGLIHRDIKPQRVQIRPLYGPVWRNSITREA